MSLKYYISVLILLSISLPVKAKEINSFCQEDNKLCSSLNEALKDKANQIALKFERVVDGDTFVAGGRMIRVWGINAPEKGDPAYRISSWLLQSILKDKILSCRLISIDKYKRDVMQCWGGDLDVGSTMVKFGMAKDYKKYSGSYYQSEEQEAKSKKRGIWSDGYIQKPPRN